MSISEYIHGRFPAFASAVHQKTIICLRILFILSSVVKCSSWFSRACNAWDIFIMLIYSTTHLRMQLLTIFEVFNHHNIDIYAGHTYRKSKQNFKTSIHHSRPFENDWEFWDMIKYERLPWYGYKSEYSFSKLNYNSKTSSVSQEAISHKPVSTLYL